MEKKMKAVKPKANAPHGSLKIKLSLADYAWLATTAIPTLLSLWPLVQARLKRLKDDPALSEFVAVLQEVTRRATT